jgi:hypothetical protein
MNAGHKVRKSVEVRDLWGGCAQTSENRQSRKLLALMMMICPKQKDRWAYSGSLQCQPGFKFVSGSSKSIAKSLALYHLGRSWLLVVQQTQTIFVGLTIL